MRLKIEIDVDTQSTFAYGQDIQFTGSARIHTIASDPIDVGHGRVLPGEARAEAHITHFEIQDAA